MSSSLGGRRSGGGEKGLWPHTLCISCHHRELCSLLGEEGDLHSWKEAQAGGPAFPSPGRMSPRRRKGSRARRAADVMCLQSGAGGEPLGSAAPRARGGTRGQPQLPASALPRFLPARFKGGTNVSLGARFTDKDVDSLFFPRVCGGLLFTCSGWEAGMSPRGVFPLSFPTPTPWPCISQPLKAPI